MNICYEQNNALRKFFHQYSQFEAVIRHDIETRLPCLISENSHKLKNARKLRFQGHRVDEYKIVLDKTTHCRVAYVVIDNTIHIIFISDRIIKNIFCDLLAKTNIVD